MKIINKVVILFFLLFTLVGCKKANKEEPVNEAITSYTQESVSTEKEEEVKSFTVSCGSGCAITYSEDTIISNDTSKEVKFKIEMYIDEVLTDEYFETYVFNCDPINKNAIIKLKGDDDFTIENQAPEIQENLNFYVKSFCGTSEQENKTKDSCLERVSLKLPYAQKVNTNSVQYKILDCEIDGMEEWLCDKEKLRYIYLTHKEAVDCILVPMDCGDFSYRFYLLTVKSNKIVGNLYVEGEWYEPGGDEIIEKTTFEMDKNYQIKVKSVNTNGEKGVTTTKTYKVNEKGVIEEA